MHIGLTSNEAKVLCAVRLNAELPIPKLARAVSMKASTVTYTLKSLLDRKVIERFTLVDITKLGYLEYDVTCALSLQGADQREKFFAYLERAPEISMVMRVGGSYHCVFTICANSPVAVEKFFRKVGDTFGSIFVDTSIGVCLRYRLFGAKYLGSTPRTLTQSVIMETSSARVVVDENDMKILAALSKHPEASVRAIASSLGMSHTTVDYRIKALRKAQVIVGQYYAVQAATFGYSKFRIYLALKGLADGNHSAIENFCQRHPNITYMVEWLGDWNYCIGVTARNSEEATEIMNSMYDSFGAYLSKATFFPELKGTKLNFFPFK